MNGLLLACPTCGEEVPPPAAPGQSLVACLSCRRIIRVPVGTSSVERPQNPSQAKAEPNSWFLRPPLGKPIGPLDRETIEQWIRDGRIGPGSMIAQEGGGSWRPVEADFGALLASRPHSRRDPCAPGRSTLAGIPPNGLLEATVCQRASLPLPQRQLHEAVLARLEKECSRSTLGIQLKSSKSLILGDPSGIEDPEEVVRLIPHSLLVVSLQWMGQEFYLVVPWGPLGQMAHEFFSILPITFPSSLALRRKNEQAFDQGVWLGQQWHTETTLCQVAQTAQTPLADGISWKWISSDGDFEMIIVWGSQFIPLGPGRSLHVIQTSLQGALRRSFGVDWYLERQTGFIRFAQAIDGRGDHEPHFLFASSTGLLLNSLLELP